MSGSNPSDAPQIIPYGDAGYEAAIELLNSGDVVAVPTETVYGLAADSTNAEAVANIYRAKGRPDFNPLIVHVPDMDTAQLLADFSEDARKLVEAFWPGPMTLVLPKAEACPVAAAVTAGLDTIALRCPAHPVMRELLSRSKMMLAAPSANKSGGISPTRPEHVADSLGANVPLILNAGATERGLESTIVACRADGCEILRPGPIDATQIGEVLGSRFLTPSAVNSIEAPGQLNSHYAPTKALRLNADFVNPDEVLIGFAGIGAALNLSVDGDLNEAAANLFEYLHRADKESAPKIAVAPIPNVGVGVAINDRLKRAAFVK